MFRRATRKILEWFRRESMKGSENLPDLIGLYVATDAPSFQTDDCFVEAIGKLTEAVYKEHRTKVLTLSLADAGNVTDLLGGMLYAALFWDMQVASSAPIGFVGTTGVPGLAFDSTVSEFIGELRSSNNE